MSNSIPCGVSTLQVTLPFPAALASTVMTVSSEVCSFWRLAVRGRDGRGTEGKLWKLIYLNLNIVYIYFLTYKLHVLLLKLQDKGENIYKLNDCFHLKNYYRSNRTFLPVRRHLLASPVGSDWIRYGE